MLEVLRSGRLSLGPAIDRFEELFAEKVGAPYAAAVSSGTAGLHLLCAIAGLGEGDEVITTPYSFVASANCFIYEGATPVFADVDERTMNLDPAAVEAAITERTKAIVAVDIFGYPCELDPLRELVRAARPGADPGRLRGARSRVQGQLGRLARRRRRLRLLSEQADDDRRGRDGHDARRGDLAIGSSACATRDAPTAAAGSTMRGSATTTASTTSAPRSGSGSSRSSTRSCRCAAGRGGALRQSCSAGVDGLELPLADDADHVRSWFVYVVTLARGTDRERVIAELERQGIATSRYLPSIHLQAYMRERYGFREGSLSRLGGSLAAHARAPVLHRDRSGGPGTSRRGARGRAGLGEALAVWALFGLQASATLVTYSRLPPEVLYNVDRSGDLAGGLGRDARPAQLPARARRDRARGDRRRAAAARLGGDRALCRDRASGRRRPGRPGRAVDQRRARARRRAGARTDGRGRAEERRRVRAARTRRPAPHRPRGRCSCCSRCRGSPPRPGSTSRGRLHGRGDPAGARRGARRRASRLPPRHCRRAAGADRARALSRAA